MASSSNTHIKSHPKLERVPKNGRVTKRPLSRPPITSEYAGKQQSKIVYLGSKTPFMSAVKRIEKLLSQSEKRAVQSASAQARAAGRTKPKVQSRDQGGDEIMQIAKALTENRDSEAVIAKGTGKAIEKAMQVGLWFQERPQYAVQLQTASTAVVDDVQIDEPIVDGKAMEVDPELKQKPLGLLDIDLDDIKDSADYSRVRQLSVLEVHVRLR